MFVKEADRSTAEGGIMRHLRCAALVLGLLWTGHAMAWETITYQYDAKGRLVKVVRTGTVNNGVTTEYTHDKVDNRTNAKTIGAP